jgi:hypothetical protein
VGGQFNNLAALPRGRDPPHSLSRRLNKLQNWCGDFGTDIKVFPFPGLETQLFEHSAQLLYRQSKPGFKTATLNVRKTAVTAGLLLFI